MYIRRKVFSLLQNENGKEKYFSTTDITMEDAEQKIFSLVEKEEPTEQREFTNNTPAVIEKKSTEVVKFGKGLSKKAKLALAAAGTAAALGGGAYAVKKARDKKKEGKK